MAFTDLFVKNLKPKSKRYYENEGKGFCVLVHPTGNKTFYFRYSINGVRKIKSLGDYPQTSLAEAHTRYYEAQSLVGRGIDPSTPPPEPTPAPEEMTIAKMCKEYMEWSEKHHAESWSYTIDKTIDKHIVPTIGDKKLTDISRRDAIKFISDIEKDGAAKIVHKTIRSVFQYAVDREYIMASPFTRLSKPVPSIVQKDRTRILTPTELKIIWPYLLQGYGTEDVRKAIRMILITAQRPKEVIGMHSDEIEEDWDGDKWWTIPRERTKNGNPHMVYLSPMALELIGKKKGFIFAPDGSAEPYERHAMSHLVAQEIKSKAGLVGKEKYYGLPRWTPHDLRRTARTNFSRMGVPLPVAEAILNHAKEGMVKVYDLHEYKDEKKKAMLMWDRELGKLFG